MKHLCCFMQEHDLIVHCNPSNNGPVYGFRRGALGKGCPIGGLNKVFWNWGRSMLVGGRVAKAAEGYDGLETRIGMGH